LIDSREDAITNEKKEKVHPIADGRLVREFDPRVNKVDKLILEQVLDEPEHDSPKSKEKPPLFSINNDSSRQSLTVAEHQDTGDEDRLL